MAEPRNGSSPEPSDMRPQRASRQMSTIGLNVQQMPSALASLAAIWADFSIAAISQLHERASGIGNTVSYPWITSIPKIKGIFKRLSSTATRCTSRIFSTPLRLKSPPTSPFFIFSATSLLLACPVTISPVTGKLSCPIFSWSVISSIRLSINLSISASLPPELLWHAVSDANATAADTNKYFTLIKILIGYWLHVK